MRHRVKCLGKVQQYYISLLTKIDAFRPVVYCRDKLCLTRKFLSKTMLLINKNIIQGKVFGHMTKNNVLHNLAADTG